MNSLSKLGLAAVLALGTCGVAISQDAGAGAGADADLDVGVDAGENMGIDAAGDMGLDLMTTGSINDRGGLVSSIETASQFDLSTAYTADATVNCVKVSALDAGAQADAQAIGSAAAGNAAIGTLRTDIQANTDLVADLEAACQVSEFDAQDIVFFETGTDGSLVFYYDDSAA